MNNITPEENLSDIVRKNYNNSKVFDKYNIDYCCNGHRSLADAAKAANVNMDDLLNDLTTEEKNTSDVSPDFDSWDSDLLVDYVVKQHHRYVKREIPPLLELLDKLINRHGDNHPELAEIREQIKQMGIELLYHMEKEEDEAFPIFTTDDDNMRRKLSQQLIEELEEEHSTEGGRLATIRQLTNDFTLPDDACNSYKVAYDRLKELEDMMHEHIHLENNILFPRAEQYLKD